MDKEEQIQEDFGEFEEDWALCKYCGLPMYQHEEGFCPSGTEEFGGRR